MFLLSFERESMSGCFEYPQYHHLTHEKIFKTIWKKVWIFLKSKYASSLSQFYMAIVVFWMKFWLWMSLKNFLCTFQACSTYLKGSPEPGLFNARWIECLRCIKHKLTLTKAQKCQILFSRCIFDRLWRDLCDYIWKKIITNEMIVFF